MGSPIAFANQMLGADAEEWQYLLSTYQSSAPLRWVNIVHPADVIAYPIAACVWDTISHRDNRLDLQDCYLEDEADLFEKTAQSVGQHHVAMALKTGKAHGSYFGDRSQNAQTVSAVFDNLIGNSAKTKSQQSLYHAAEKLKCCPGMTLDQNPQNIQSAKTILTFADGSGSVAAFVNAVQVDHIYVFDRYGTVAFGGYVGWLHHFELKQTLKSIQKLCC